eukprot:TRINITY_DN8342_c0_g1_i1.p1 TRINITY_DN8342_c0_g1~~TRINITY_DN8342_c0_g1_i1.p1  ORF type:complete len:949 (+),score=186.16 TRINITY_DN8342_c0_g1_i1:18-2864(+)
MRHIVNQFTHKKTNDFPQFKKIRPQRHYILSTKQIRYSFLNFFNSNSHTVVESDSLVPKNDPSLLFTNAGMVQFKDYFLGYKNPPYPRAVTVQKCLRVSGKHNDLEEVGHTTRHQTFFEMLGNFSFRNYGKAEAIQLAWIYLTQILSLPEDRLFVSVLKGDIETEQLWKAIGVPEEHIFRLGEEDNFWSMGSTGPCGPCTEIFWDRQVPGPERFLEIWNLVFMQYDMKEDGHLEELGSISVDTGMGLERLTSVMQNVPNNFAIDSMVRLQRDLYKLIQHSMVDGKSSQQIDISLRVVVDHLRSVAFLISEGIMPSNEGRGYVLRRLLRRAVRYGHIIGFRKPFMAGLLPSLIDEMGETYPELERSQDHITNVITTEEDSFFQVIDNALEKLDVYMKKNPKELNGKFAFDLYSRYGFPIDLTSAICKEKGIQVDMKTFEELVHDHKEKSKTGWTGSGEVGIDTLLLSLQKNNVQNIFTGYSTLSERTHVLGAVEVEGKYAWIVPGHCPFFPTSGGQVGDIGTISFTKNDQTIILDVTETINAYQDCIAIKVNLGNVPLKWIPVGTLINCTVDRSHRKGCTHHHTATHVLHKALRVVLGEHVKQVGSLVEPTRLRFDFSHPAPLTPEQIKQVEGFVNDVIQRDINVNIYKKKYEEAMKSKNIMSIFGEKYPEEVRVVDIDDESVELCGGTHVHRTLEMIYFKIISESSVALGRRRIEATTGVPALNFLERRSEELENLGGFLNVPTEDIQQKIKELKVERKELKTLVNQLKGNTENSKSFLENMVHYSGQYYGKPLHLYIITTATDKDQKIKILDYLRQSDPHSIHLLAHGSSVLCSIGNEKEHAGKLLSGILSHIGGRGGGSPTLGQGVLDENALLIDKFPPILTEHFHLEHLDPKLDFLHLFLRCGKVYQTTAFQHVLFHFLWNRAHYFHEQVDEWSEDHFVSDSPRF